jgi:hypothetical protein
LSCSDEPEWGEAGIGVVAVEVSAVEREGTELATTAERGIGYVKISVRWIGVTVEGDRNSSKMLYTKLDKGCDMLDG